MQTEITIILFPFLTSENSADIKNSEFLIVKVNNNNNKNLPTLCYRHASFYSHLINMHIKKIIKMILKVHEPHRRERESKK